MNSIKRLRELYNELQETEIEIKKEQKMIEEYSGAGVRPEVRKTWLKQEISRKSLILIEIKKLEKSDLMKDVLLLLHDNKVNEAISIIKEELEGL